MRRKTLDDIIITAIRDLQNDVAIADTAREYLAATKRFDDLWNSNSFNEYFDRDDLTTWYKLERQVSRERDEAQLRLFRLIDPEFCWIGDEECQ